MSADGVPAWARIGFGLDRGRLLLPSPTQRTFLCILFILSLSVAQSLTHSLPLTERTSGISRCHFIFIHFRIIFAEGHSQ